jgi:hypothetical protein
MSHSQGLCWARHRVHVGGAGALGFSLGVHFGCTLNRKQRVSISMLRGDSESVAAGRGL